MLASWLPDGQATLSDVFLEVVEPAPDDLADLADWLLPAFGREAEDIAEFLTVEHPISKYSQLMIGADGDIDDSATLHFRATEWLEIHRGPGRHDETLVVRPLRLVGRDSAVVAAWGPTGGFPRYPREHSDEEPVAGRVPGGIVGDDLAPQARPRGDPEWLVELEHGIGSSGPRRVPQLLSEWEDNGGPPGQVAETLFAQCVRAMHDVADGLAIVLDRWEALVLERARSRQRGSRFELPALADIGATVDFVDHHARAVGRPTSNKPAHYFTTSPASAEIEAAAEDTVTTLHSLRERIRTGLALVSAVLTSQALEVAEETQSGNEDFQRIAGILGAVILGPTLVAGLFGANTALPGGGNWWGFGIMLALMVVSAVALLVVLRRLGSFPESD
jgi:hypothetical protein